MFTEVIVAPGYEDGAVEVLAGQEEHPASSRCPARRRAAGRAAADQRRRSWSRCATTSTRRRRPGAPGRWPAGEPASAEVLADLAFAWRACRAVKSNAILLAAGGASVGVGMGQVNRVDSAGSRSRAPASGRPGAVAASDAFFPFADGLEMLIDAGVRGRRAARRLGPRRGGRRGG